MKATRSASCSMAPDSRRSESCGRLLPPRDSTERFNCESAMIGTLSSLAIALSDREIMATSCSRLLLRLSVEAVISCR